MNSEIASRLKLRYAPIAILFSNERPPDAMEFVENRWGCAVAMLTAAAKGKTVVFSRKTFGCLGGGVGLGLGNLYPNFPGGIHNFLSTGAGEGYPEGEGYKKTPEFAAQFVRELPITDIEESCVVFKPLVQAEEEEKPRIVQRALPYVLRNGNKRTRQLSRQSGLGKGGQTDTGLTHLALESGGKNENLLY